jgi:hypothetical protein
MNIAGKYKFPLVILLLSVCWTFLLLIFLYAKEIIYFIYSLDITYEKGISVDIQQFRNNLQLHFESKSLSPAITLFSNGVSVIFMLLLDKFLEKIKLNEVVTQIRTIKSITCFVFAFFILLSSLMMIISVESEKESHIGSWFVVYLLAILSFYFSSHVEVKKGKILHGKEALLPSK